MLVISIFEFDFSTKICWLQTLKVVILPFTAKAFSGRDELATIIS